MLVQIISPIFASHSIYKSAVRKILVRLLTVPTLKEFCTLFPLSLHLREYSCFPDPPQTAYRSLVDWIRENQTWIVTMFLNLRQIGIITSIQVQAPADIFSLSIIPEYVISSSGTHRTLAGKEWPEKTSVILS